MALSNHELHVLDELERQLATPSPTRQLRSARQRLSRTGGATSWLLGLAGFGLIAVGLAFGDPGVVAALAGYVVTVLAAASISGARHRRGRPHLFLRGLRLLRHYGPGPDPRS